MRSCTICPRECGVDRAHSLGYCCVKDTLTVSRAALHHWEEPCISGTKGSGTVFFSGCNVGCVFCQNHRISRGRTGKEITPERLCDIFFELKEQGAHNINLVTPTHYLPQLLPVIEKAKKNGIGIPFVYNCSGYEKVEMLRAAEGLIDIYLPDFKFISPVLSTRYANATDYGEIAKRAIHEMVRQQPVCRFDEDGIIEQGVIVRHLMLPGNLKDSKDVLAYLAHTYKDQIFISIMNQFTPTPQLLKYPEINRCVTKQEYDKLIDYAISLDIEQAYIQEGETAKESFIPDFSNQGV